MTKAKPWQTQSINACAKAKNRNARQLLHGLKDPVFQGDLLPLFPIPDSLPQFLLTPGKLSLWPTVIMPLGLPHIVPST